MELTRSFIVQEQFSGKRATYLTVISLTGGIPFKIACQVAIKPDQLLVPLNMTFSNFCVRMGRDGNQYFTADSVSGSALLKTK